MAKLPEEQTNGSPEALQPGPLSGITVLDLSRIAAGPYAASVLSDLGAEVIKVERPETGDDVRHDGAFVGGESGIFLGVNRGKRSITLDLKSPADRPLLDGLVRWADVVIENFRPGVADRLGLSYDDLKRVNSRIIYVSSSGFGRKSEKPNRPAYDMVAQGVTGVMHITGEPDRAPSKIGPPIADLSAGMWMVTGCLAALYHRAMTGEGQRVDTSLVGSALTHLSVYLTAHWSGVNVERDGSRHTHLAPMQAFSGSDDQYFIVAAGNDRLFERLTAVLELPELATDPRFRTGNLRVEHRYALGDLLQEVFSREPAAHWIATLEEGGVPVSIVQTLDQVIDDSDFRRNGYIREMEHPTAGKVPVVMTPLEFSRTPVGIRRPAPLLNQHDDEVRRLIAPYVEEGTD
jgi:crotonobetainyl-CoA:carnitine CoA-transferase CaiB-like acyl-CoA transferase